MAPSSGEVLLESAGLDYLFMVTSFDPVEMKYDLVEQ